MVFPGKPACPMSELQRLGLRPSPPTDDLLHTKLAPPRLHSTRVPRTSLLARLNEGLTRKLTLISAPAGFGKTTLVAEWVVAHPLKAGGDVTLVTPHAVVGQPPLYRLGKIEKPE
jgi:hypothetical protein